MNEEALRRALNELTSLYDRAEGEPRTLMELGHPGHVIVQGNQLGLVSLACASLTAALGPVDAVNLPRQVATLDERHFQLAETDTQKYLGWIERQENIPELAAALAARQRPVRFADRLLQAGCAFLGLTLLFLLISGFIFWVAILADIPALLP